MKKSLFSAMLLLSVAGAAVAQSVTGKWSYKSPVAKIEGVDFGSKVGNAMFNRMMGGAMKQEIAHDLDSLGFNSRTASLLLNENGTFEMPVSDGFVKGTYLYDTNSGEIALTVDNGFRSAGKVGFDGSKMNVFFTLEGFSDFMIMVSLARYCGDIPASAADDIRAVQEKSAAELKEVRDGLRQLNDRLNESDGEVNGSIDKEDIERIARAFADMEMYMGLVFGK